VAILIDAQPLSINPGTHEVEHAIDAPGTLVVRLARKTTVTPTLWADGVSLAVRLDVSSDAGQTWRGLAGFTAIGGIWIGRNEETGVDGEIPETRLLCPFPDDANRARLSVTVAGGTFNSLLTVERI
jgi:hypothetical protein